MANKKPSKVLVSPQSGVLRNMVTRLKLIARLMGDRRVNIFLKLIPVGALVYLISPVDLLPGAVFPVIGALDDAAVLWMGSTLFVELCPPGVVNEYMQELNSNVTDDSDDIVDAETTDADNN